jgi:hypothetical protein
MSENAIGNILTEIGEAVEEHRKHNTTIMGGPCESALTVENVHFNVPTFEKAEQTQYVAVRPVDSEKTYLGIMLGECPTIFSGNYNDETKTLSLVGRGNPMMYVPDLETSVFGYESWWTKIETKEDLKMIADADIQNVWYVKALKTISEEQE